MQNGLTIEVRSLSDDGARLALAAAQKAASDRSLAVSIAVVDVAGNLVAFQRLKHACATSIEAAQRKAQTAVHLCAPTKVFEDLVEKHGKVSLLAFEFLCPSQGGIPITSDGVTIGAIGCSGSSGDDDEAIALAGAAALTSALSAEA